MGDINFSSTARFSKAGSSNVNRAGAIRLRTEGNERAVTTGRSFEHSRANQVREVLSSFYASGDLADLQAEAEEMPDIMNYNPAMLAGAMVFYSRSSGVFSPQLFQKHAPGIIKHLIDARILDKDRKNENVKYTIYTPDFLRYVLILGQMRNVPIPQF